MFTQLRTPSYLLDTALSDVHSASDTTSSFWYYLVRCSLGFGHNFILMVLLCPMFTRLRTPHIFLVLLCPMFTRLRTPPHLFGTALSKVEQM
ncbi:hypothetical protein [Neobacillus cucumis]|uniref:hypothetical protein n=1 Tax=Neobacillus cucumis TaxID=1740721 RepID=UPI00196480E2|nr:hypothetical protein [Neobacillus cucumis]